MLVVSFFICIFAVEIKKENELDKIISKDNPLEYILLHNQYFLVKIYKISIDFLTKN